MANHNHLFSANRTAFLVMGCIEASWAPIVPYIKETYGLDEGQLGTWEIALQNADIFCRIAPLSGRIEMTEQNLETLGKFPVWAVVGTADRIRIAE